MESGEKVFRVAMLLRSDHERIREVVGQQYLDCAFDYYPVHDLEDLREVFLQIKGKYDGVLTSGVFSDRFIAYYSQGENIPHQFFSISVENYYRQILLQIMYHPQLNFGDIRLDLMGDEHNLPDIIEQGQLGPLMQEEQTMVNRMTPGQIMDFEKEMIQRHERAVQSGSCKLFLTHSVMAMEVFEGREVRHIYVKLTAHEIFKTVNKLRREMELKELKDSQVASIYFDLGDTPTQQELERVREALEEFNRGHPEAGLVFSEVEGHFVTLTDAQTIFELTRDNSCEFTGFLWERTGIPVAVGYGIGTTAQGAKDHAASAARYAQGAQTHLKQTFLVDSNRQIIPLSTRLMEVGARESQTGQGEIFESTVNEVAKQAHLSSRTVLNLMMALQRHHRREASSDWLSRELKLSSRMANKILSNLEKAGYAHISGKYLLGEKGRPSNIYTFRFDVRTQ